MVRRKKTKGPTPQSSNVEPIVAAAASSSSSSSPLPPARRSLSFSASKNVTATATPTVGAAADVLCVGLSKSKVSTGTNAKGGGGGASVRYLPRVFLSEQDASSLDILPDEDVVVLGRSSTDNEASSLSGGALICKAIVSKQPSSLKSPTTSYSSPSSSRKSTSSFVVAVGSIQIQPSDMISLLLSTPTTNSDESLFGFSERTVISESHVPGTPLTPAAAKSQTTPKSNDKSFSFQIGGGGDALYNSTSPSPSSIRKPPTTPLSSSSSSISALDAKDRFWILPLESRLGSRVAQQIINNNNTSSNNGPCYRIHLEPLPNVNIMVQKLSNTIIENCDAASVPSMTIPSSTATRILERIILATYIGRFVQAREIVRVTFQGKLLQLQVTRIETTKTTTTSQADHDNTNQRTTTSDHEKTITEEFEKLALGSDNDNSNINYDSNNTQKHYESSSSSSEDAKQLLQQLSCFRTTNQLYQVTYETKISVSAASSSSSSYNIGMSKVDYSCTGPNHQQQCAVAAADAVVVQHVVGLSSVMKQVHDLLWTPLTRPELFVQKEGTAAIKAPRGILLHGPSGVGKSSLARQVAAELESSPSCRCEVQFVNCILLQSQTALVGQAERQLSKYFQPPKQQGRPKLLIFDDIHLICPRRGGGGFTDQLASTLLALLDGIESSIPSSSLASPSGSGSLRHKKNVATNKAGSTSPVVILAVTSNPSLLDPALRRPGRLDVEVEVPIPDEPSARAEILRFHVMQKTASPGPLAVPALTDDDWIMLAMLAKGFTGADCMLAVKEAVRTALFRRLHLSAQSTSLKSEHATAVELTIHDLASAVRATKPSSIKSITVEIPRVKWNDIGGMDEVKRELHEAIELPLTHGDLFQRLGVPPPRGILLYGPPGCSKTLMARALATEGQMNFLSVKGPELLSKWLGESERALASLFRRARMASPSIIFFDEIDAIASARGSGDSSGGGGRLLSQLLTELDGVVYTNSSAKGSKSNRVVVVGATNRPDLLDRALSRPGRIDRMIYVGVPDTESRRQIFKVTLKDKFCDSDIDLEYLSQDEVTKGFSGAEIVAICQDAALFALEETDDSPPEVVDHKSTTKVSMRHLLKATMGMQRQITPEMLDFYATYQNNTNTNI
jgi:SpoVK/Ycf46/Vps4 family AAA+-type ATPase